MYIYLYIYIYIYIYTDSFVVSQLLSVGNHARSLKPRSKPGWFYISQISYPRDLFE